MNIDEDTWANMPDSELRELASCNNSIGDAAHAELHYRQEVNRRASEHETNMLAEALLKHFAAESCE